VSISSSIYNLYPTPFCNPDFMRSQITSLQQLAAVAGTNRTAVDANGTTGYLADWAALVPVPSPDTQAALATVLVSAKDSLILCSKPSTRASSASGGIIPVGTPQQLLAALSAAASPDVPTSTVIQLQQDIGLTAAAAANYSLPFVISGNHTVTLQGGGRAAASSCRCACSQKSRTSPPAE
jgi:hypothetical protein